VSSETLSLSLRLKDEKPSTAVAQAGLFGMDAAQAIMDGEDARLFLRIRSAEQIGEQLLHRGEVFIT